MGELEVKKMMEIIIALSIIFTGCSNEKPSVNNNVQKNANNTAIENTSVSNTKQPQSQPQNTSQSAKNINSNTKSSSLDNINTAKSPFEKGYYDYQGTVGNNMSIHMSIYPLGTDIVGSYFYDSKGKEIKLKGKAGAKDIVLYEYDDTSKNTGIFKGTLNGVDKIKGTWMGADNKTNYQFTLSLKSIILGVEYGKRYAETVGTESDQDVENFVSKVQSYVVNDNKEQLSEQISYPITVNINSKVTKIQNKDDFIKNYDQIFYPKYKQIIGNAFTKYMFANWQGIMFGENSNNIWINEVTPTGGKSKLMITAINN